MKIGTWSASIDNIGQVWMPVLGTNSILKMDSSGNVEYAGTLKSGDGLQNGNNILKVFPIDEKVFFFSRNTFECWILDNHTLDVEHHIYCSDQVNIISDIVLLNNCVWILPNSFDTNIIKLNLKNLEADRISWGMKPYEGRPALIRAQIDGKCIYSATRNKDNIYLVIIDTERDEVTFQKMNLAMANCIYMDEENSWMLALDKKGETLLQKYSRGFGTIEKEYAIEDIERIDALGNLYYFEIVVYKNLIYFIPSIAKKIYLYDTDTMSGTYMEYPLKMNNKEKQSDFLTFTEIQRKKDILYIFPHYYEQLVMVNLGRGSFNVITPRYSDDLIRLLISNNSETIMYENGIYGVDDLLNILKE